MSDTFVPTFVPTVEPAGLTELKPGVWVIPDGAIRLVPNIAIVEGERSVLVVDTGMGRDNARRVLEAARTLAAGRRLLLTVTHFHPEHGFGAEVFAGAATIVYNAAQRDELRDKGPGYLEMFRTFGPAVAASLEGVELAGPDLVYSGELGIDLGGREVRLIEVGPAHTRGDQIVWLPAERVVVAGDLLETDVFPIFPFFPPDDADVDGNKWIAVLRRIAALGPETVVPGHCAIRGADIIEETERYLLDLGSRTQQLKDAGLDADAAVAELEPIVRAEHPSWREPNWVEAGIRCFHATGFTVSRS
ncbi:MBL fold metallo-hydrolase [Nonomuraea sp. NBC_01738]|uniref:MBL fold metallo-hydrolase n=1 Tax=Nonomuraea sp. NBC_01738 TaxID=2976003 RepID=UPI002E0FCAB7|nr:MBL fold metallo-hydrolase [Nonomuraea sp. NBC_01738]